MSSIRTILLFFLLLSGLAAQTLYPQKCGFSARHSTAAYKIAALARPVRQAVFISPDSAFAIHYDTTGIHKPPMTSTVGSPTPDWVIEVAKAFSYSRNLLLEGGYRATPADADSLYDVYLGDLEKNWYGLTQPDGTDQYGRTLSYIEIDNDFSEDEPFFTHGIDAARVTAAHEYFHAVQMGIKPFIRNDQYFYELSSTWFEDVAYPDINDWAHWFDAGYQSIGRNPERAMDQTDGYSIALFGHFLTEPEHGYGDGFMRRVWERFVDCNAATALDEELRQEAANLTSIWVEFITGTFFNGTESEYRFYADQTLLNPPQLIEEVLTSSTPPILFPTLWQARAGVKLLGLAEPSNVKLQITDAPSGYTAKVILDSGDRTPFNLSQEPWFGTGLHSLSKLIIVTGAQNGPIEVLAVVSDTSFAPGFAIDQLWPNPICPQGKHAPVISLVYRADIAIPEAAKDVKIYNLLGQELYRESTYGDIGEGTNLPLIIEIPGMANWATGVYFLEFTVAGKHRLYRKFTVIH